MRTEKTHGTKEQKSKTKASTPIHLKDVGIDVWIGEKSLKKVKIKTTPQGIEISVPTRTGKDEREEAIVLASWLVLFIVGEIAIIWQLFLSLLGKSNESIDWGVGAVLGLGWLLLFGVATIPIVAKSLFGKEKIILSKKTLKIGNYIFGKSKLRIGQEHTYNIMNISNLRRAPQEHWLQETEFCKNVGATEASVLLKHLSDIITFRCHSTEFIIFGTSFLNNDDPYTTLHNPDVSELTFPIVHLKRVVIHTETYDFHQVERFLTYAVNYIGQEYLKKHVEVAVYGDPEKLHPNLRNSFENLCKQIQMKKS